MRKPICLTLLRGISEYGPGHNSFTISEDGQYLMVCHARDYKETVGDSLYDKNRHTKVIRFDADEILKRLDCKSHI